MSQHFPNGAPATDRSAEAGASFLEVLLAMVLVAIALASVAGSIGSNLKANARSQTITHGSRFLQEVLASIDMQTYDALLTMNGNIFYDTGVASSARLRVDYTAATIAVDLIEVTAVLRDQRTGRELTRVGLLRSRR